MKSLLLLSCVLTAAQAIKYCPLLGPVYPAPTNLSMSASLIAATTNLSQKLDSIVREGSTASSTSSIFDANTTSFTIQIYSAANTKSLFDYYYTAPSANNASTGVRTVDENTVFRIGSASKLWTVFLFLITAGEEALNDPVSKYVPELRSAVAGIAGNVTAREDTVNNVRWEEVTVRELTTHLAGIGRDYGFLDLSLFDPALSEFGFPQLSQSDTPPCGLVAACNRTQFFDGILDTHPMAPTSATPIYSNAAIQILAYALETITNKTYSSLLSEHLTEPLNLSHSTFSKPADGYGIIPVNATASGWNLDAGDETPAGGLYSSTKDMSRLGRAILNSTLLSPAATRRWMKPASHTSSLDFAVGAPWEIFSVHQSGRTIDLYTKAGDFGNYSSMTALSPDHNVGFTILAAGDGTTALVAALSDAITGEIFPALEQAGKEEASKTFSGTYASLSSTKNSSITINAACDLAPGLKVERWISDSVDMFEVIARIAGVEDVAIQLYPTGLRSPGRASSKVSFRAIFESSAPWQQAVKDAGPFTRSCSTWETVDRYVYGNVGIDEFLFEVDVATGDAVSISPRAVRETLPKSSA